MKEVYGARGGGCSSRKTRTAYRQKYGKCENLKEHRVYHILEIRKQMSNKRTGGKFKRLAAASEAFEGPWCILRCSVSNYNLSIDLYLLK